jgi:HD-GYP domain-containing protein (c-di-GMP phosphodiesterase class II)
MATKQVPVALLEFGMYIAELDRPWTDTPFRFQGFYLRTGQQLEALRKYCRYVFVDAARSEPAAHGARATPDLAATTPRPIPAAGMRIRGSARYPELTDVESEIKAASALYAQSVQALQALFVPLSQGRALLEGAQVQAAVARLADSVVRNPDALLLMSKMREKSAAAHARALQVSIYMMVFARFLQLERAEIELLGLLGLLQDIGKTRLPAALLEKQGPLTPEESEVVKKHVELSGHILGATSGLPPELAVLALLHHERQDGGGYPRGLKADQIGLYGSMAAICDIFDALLAFRPYAEQSSPSAAADFLLKERGAAFHAELVEQFIQCIGPFPLGSVVELNSGEVGIVIALHPEQRLKPKVAVVLDASGGPVRANRILDLDKDPRTESGEPYRIRRTREHGMFEYDPRELSLSTTRWWRAGLAGLMFR